MGLGLHQLNFGPREGAELIPVMEQGARSITWCIAESEDQQQADRGPKVFGYLLSLHLTTNPGRVW